MVKWHWAKLSELSPEEQYELHQVRQAVFVLEQGITYVDADGKDHKAYHLLGWDSHQLVAYLRVIPKNGGVRIGRVLTRETHRGIGLGKELITVALEKIAKTYGNVPIEMSAQAHLEGFYQTLGFLAIGSPFNMEGVPHIEMMREASQTPH